MGDFILFVSAILFYFFLACAFNRVLRLGFPSKSSAGSSSLRRSVLTIASFMTILSLVAVVLLQKAFLAMPGVYAGLIVAMLLGGEGHGPGDPWSWTLIAAPVNFFLYYWIVRAFAKRYPSLF
jgi:hypothetical protein